MCVCVCGSLKWTNRTEYILSIQNHSIGKSKYKTKFSVPKLYFFFVSLALIFITWIYVVVSILHHAFHLQYFFPILFFLVISRSFFFCTSFSAIFSENIFWSISEHLCLYICTSSMIFLLLSIHMHRSIEFQIYFPIL